MRHTAPFTWTIICLVNIYNIGIPHEYVYTGPSGIFAGKEHIISVSSSEFCKTEWDEARERGKEDRRVLGELEPTFHHHLNLCSSWTQRASVWGDNKPCWQCVPGDGLRTEILFVTNTTGGILEGAFGIIQLKKASLAQFVLLEREKTADGIAMSSTAPISGENLNVMFLRPICMTNTHVRAQKHTQTNPVKSF